MTYFDPDSFDTYLNMELAIDRGRAIARHAKVTKKMKDHRDNPVGTTNEKPIKDTWMYGVEFHNGNTQAMSANVISENMLANIDEEEHRHILLDCITGLHSTNITIAKSDSFVINSKDNKQNREMTKA